MKTSHLMNGKNIHSNLKVMNKILAQKQTNDRIEIGTSANFCVMD